jgi:hypothetical protein
MNKEEKIELVNVTIGIPKPIVDLFDAVQKLAKGKAMSLEHWIFNRFIFGLETDLYELHIKDLFGVEPGALIEAYGLDKVFKSYYEEHPLTDEDVVVKIPKAMVNDIRNRPWFKQYEGIEQFVREAMRNLVIKWESGKAK